MKINLLIDSNNFLNRVLFGLEKYSKYKEKIPDYKKPKFSKEEHLPNEEVGELFLEKIEADFNYLLKDIPQPDNIFFLQDSSSWRKQVLINGEKTYKINRKKKLKEKSINWDIFESATNKFLEKYSGIIPIRINGLEADDLIYLVKDKLIEYNSECLNIIMSTDGDFNQLLDYNTIIYNHMHTNPRFLISNEYDIKEYKNMNRSSFINKKEENPFDMSDHSFSGKLSDSKKIFESIENSFNIESEDPKLSLFIKVLNGDKKDDVPSIYYWDTEKSKIRVTARYYNKIIDYYNKHELSISMDDFLTEKNARTIKSLLETYVKRDVDLKTLATNLKRNRLLLYLSKDTIPNKLVEQFDKNFENLKDKMNLS